MLCVLEDHVNGLVFQDDLTKCDKVAVVQLAVELPSALPVVVALHDSGLNRSRQKTAPALVTHHDLASATLRNARVRLLVALFVGLELLDSEHFTFLSGKVTWAHAQLGIV